MGRPFSFRTAALNHAKSLVLYCTVPYRRFIFRKFFRLLSMETCMLRPLNARGVLAVLRIRYVYPGSEFFHPGSRIRIFSIPNPGSASKNLRILTQKIVSKLSEI
jgi:hypothetical protein